MWSRFHTAADAFGLGICLEYIIRVEISIYPILIGSLLLISVILDLCSDYLKNRKKLLMEELEKTTQEIGDEIENLTLPKSWMVYEAGQNPLNMLWFVNAVNFSDLTNEDHDGDPRQVFVEDGDSYEDALKEIISRIKLGETENN